MATFEASGSDKSFRLKKSSKTPEVAPEVGNSEGFVDKFKNVGLESESEVDLEVKESGGGSDGSSSGGGLPLRPYAGDCAFYMRNGTCKFGLTCRFNHPVKRTRLVSEAVKENMKDLSSVDYSKILCKYYFSPGGCKYGDSCRYSHPKDESEFAVLDVNSLGLPLRLGEKECPYYMRHGSCRYGVRCVFHHPELTLVGEFDSFQSTLDDSSIIQSGFSLGSSSSESASLLLRGASQLYHAPWAQGMQRHAGYTQYQASDYPQERSRQAYLTPVARTKAESKVSVQGEDLQPLCGHLLKTGDCPHKSACRFRHPKDWEKSSCELSENGLPLRPGKTICRDYERFGICKYGRACAYDHPIDHALQPYPVGSTSKSASSHDTVSEEN